MKTIIIFLLVFLILFLTGCGKKEDVLENLPDFNSSEEEGLSVGGDLQLAEIDLEGEQKGSLKVLSGNFFPVRDQEGKSVIGARLIGEVKNTGEETIRDISSIVRFFDKNEKEIGTKVGAFFTGFEFLPIESGKIGLYDLFIAQPPSSERAQILMEIKRPQEEKKMVALKLITKRVTETEQETTQRQEGSTTSSQSNQTIKFFSCVGSFTNDQEIPVKDMVVLVWLKNKEDKVFAYGMKKFTQDLLLPSKSKEFEINFIPFVEDKMVSFEIRVFGESYQK